MKISWGKKIAIFYSLFVLFIIGMVILSFNEKYDLVTENYYDEELKFQDRIDQEQNVLDEKNQLLVFFKNDSIQIDFTTDKNTTSGVLNWFRPSDESLDFSEAINAPKGIHACPINKFSKGKYVLKAEWKAQTKSYYQEQIIIIP